jgi:DUF971 family protein
LTPATIKRLGKSSIEIVWQDGHRGVYANRYLRDHCPCAGCRDAGVRRLPVHGRDDVHAETIGLVGRYAISIRWSDGHGDGIYSYGTLRQLCPCAACQPQPAAGVAR